MRVLRNQEGFGIVGTMIIMVAMLALATAVATVAITNRSLTQQSYEKSDSLELAEAGADKGIYAFNKNTSYTGETTSLGSGKFTTTVTAIDSSDKYITSVATVTQGTQTYTRTVRVKMTATPSTSNVSFNYAVQVGTGGIQMSNNATITGTVYSAGN